MSQQEKNVKLVIVNDLRIGDYVILKDDACVIATITKSHPRKHGTLKVYMITKNIFTDKKVEDIWPALFTIKCPIITKMDYQLSNIEYDNSVVLLNENMKEIHNLVCKKIKTMFKDEKCVIITIISALSKSRIFDCVES